MYKLLNHFKSLARLNFEHICLGKPLTTVTDSSNLCFYILRIEIKFNLSETLLDKVNYQLMFILFFL